MAKFPTSTTRIFHQSEASQATGSETRQGLEKSTAEISFLLFVLGGVTGMIDLTSILPFGSGFEMVALAKNLSQHGAFANPLLVMPTGPSAATPPLYPVFLAILMVALHVPKIVFLAATVCSVIADATTAALLPRVSVLVFGKVMPGIFASILWLMSAQLMPSWDVNVTVCLLLFFVIYSCSTMSEARLMVHASFAGLQAGALFLLNPMTLLVFLPWLIHLLYTRGAPYKRSVAYCAIVLGVTSILAFPWALRNHYALGSFVVRTSFGRTIYASNVDCSKTSLVEDLQSGCAASYQVNFNREEAIAFRDLGEVNYDRVRLAAAKEWIHSHRNRFLRLTFDRFLAFWFPRTVEHPFKAITIWIFTLLSLAGLIFMAHHREPVTAFIVVTLLIYPIVYYVIVSDVRYRYPILWLSLLPTGYFLAWLSRPLQTRFLQFRQMGAVQK